MHAALGVHEEAAVCLPLHQRQKRAQGVLAVADQADLDRIAQADAHLIQLDLHGPRLAGLGQKLDIGKRRSHH